MPAHGRPRAIGIRISGHLRSAAPVSFRRLYLQRAWRRLGPESNRSVGGRPADTPAGNAFGRTVVRQADGSPKGFAIRAGFTAVAGVSREESCQFSRPALPYATEHSPSGA